MIKLFKQNSAIPHTKRAGFWISFSFRHFLNENEEGQGLVEYGLILFLVVVVVVLVLATLGPQIGSIFSGVTKGIS